MWQSEAMGVTFDMSFCYSITTSFVSTKCLTGAQDGKRLDWSCSGTVVSAFRGVIAIVQT